MIDPRHSQDAPRPDTQDAGALLEDLCDRFEREWRNGKRPRVESWLSKIGTEHQDELLRELLCIEIEFRRRNGEIYQREQIAKRFPDKDAAWVDEVLNRLRTDEQVLFVGETIGKYKIEAAEARGAFGSVYRARDSVLDRIVALKVARRPCGASALNELKHESQLLASLRHPGIVPIYDFGQLENGVPFVVLEYMPGKSLAARLDRGPVAWQTAVNWMVYVAQAVHYIHRRGLIHRDLKPANIVLDEHDIPRVTDFGLAFRSPTAGANAAEFAGTPCYMAPEQLRANATAGVASDVWALGAILYELLTGRRPFSIDQLQAMADEGRVASWVLPSSMQAGIPSRLDRICARCFELEPSQRISSASHLAEELNRCIDPPLVTRRRAIAAVSGAAALLAGAAWSVWHRSAGRLRASIHVLAWDETRGVRWLDQPGALPLLGGDAVRLQVKLSEPAYAYATWIDAQAHPVPLFPGGEGEWNWTGAVHRIKELALPDTASDGWEMEVTEPGLETIVVGATRRPLDMHEIDEFKRTCKSWEHQPPMELPVLLEFHRGRLQHTTTDRTRKPQVDVLENMNHALFRNQRLLQSKMGGTFDEIAAVTFSCRPKSTL